MTPEQERAEARKALETLKREEWTNFDGQLDSRIVYEYDRLTEDTCDIITECKTVEVAHLIANAPTWLRNSLDREEQLIAENKQLTILSEAVTKQINSHIELVDYLNGKVAEQDKEIQQYRAALEEIAQGGDKDHVGNVLTLTSSECRTIARKALNQS